MIKKRLSKVKRKQIIKVSPGESVLIMPYDTLMYLAETCDILARDQPTATDSIVWMDIADQIRYQSAENYYEVEEEEWM